MTTVEKIHNEIDTAQDRLLKKANDIINNTQISESTKIEAKAERLKKLGFTSSVVVKEADNVANKRNTKLRELQISKEQANLITYYKRKYPLHKFLTEDELDRICDKYKLVYASVDRYIKDIPEKNLEEIESMKEIDKSDLINEVFTLNLEYWMGVPKKVRDWFNGREFPLSQGTSDRELIKVCPIKFNGRFLYRSGGISINHVNKSGLFISAPKSHFNLKGLTKVKNGFFDVFKVEPEDPIVFKYVKGGILVITKWGEEASDPALFNEIDN